MGDFYSGTAYGIWRIVGQLHFEFFNVLQKLSESWHKLPGLVIFCFFLLVIIHYFYRLKFRSLNL